MKKKSVQLEDEKSKRASKEIVDKPTKEDLLGFKRFADPIANRIINAFDENTQLTVVIYGEWGCGKTSFLQMVDDNLYNKGIAPIWFNAWKYDKEDNLWSALLQTILAQASVSGNLGRRAWVKFIIWKDGIHLRDGLWEVVKKLLPVIFRIIVIIAGLIILLGLDKNTIGNLFNKWLPGYSLIPLYLQNTIIKSIGAITTVGTVATFSLITLLKGKLDIDFSKFSHKPSYRERIAFLDEFSTEFQKIVRLLGRGKPLVVIIDDLDRCPPEKALQVFEAIKNFLDVEGCVFLLALDRKMLEKAVATKYKEMNALDADKEGLLRRSALFHEEYMEKVFQLSISLPRLAENQIEDFVKSLSTDEDIQLCASIFGAGLPPNPRKIKRILRTFLFIRDMVGEDIRKGEIRTSLLTKLIVIQNCLFDVYEAIAERPSLLQDLEKYYQQLISIKSQPPSIGEDATLRDRAQKYTVNYPELQRILLKKIDADDTFVSANINRYISLVGALAEVKPFQDETKAALPLYLQFVLKYTEYSLGTFVLSPQLIERQHIADFFIAPYFTKVIIFPSQDIQQQATSSNATQLSPIEPVDMKSILRQSSRIVIQGDTGSGKTTLINYLAYEFAKFALRGDKEFLETNLGVQDELIPIVVRLNEYNLDSKMKRTSLIEFFKQHIGEMLRLSNNFFFHYLERGKCIVLFDGLDEIDANYQSFAIDEINALCALFPLNRYVITSLVLPYRSEQSYPLGFQIYTIMPWNDEQIARYIQHAFISTKDRTNNRPRVESSLQTILSDQNIKSLASKPIFLSIIIQLLYHLNEIPRSRAKLYDEVFKILLNSYARSAYRGEINPIIMHDVLADIAFETKKNHEMLISEDRVKKILAQKRRGDTEKLNQIIAFIKNQIFLFTEQGPNLFGFVHISLQEYFASVALLHHAHFVRDALDFWQKDEQTWKEVILFAVDALSSTDQDLGDQLIDALLATQKYSSVLFAGECLLRSDMKSVKINLPAKTINALIKIEEDEDIERVIRERAKDYKMKLQKELDTLRIGETKDIENTPRLSTSLQSPPPSS